VMMDVYADQWEKPEVRDLNLNGDPGACEVALPDGNGWEETIAFDSPATLRAWLTALTEAVDWYLVGREPRAEQGQATSTTPPV